MRYYIYISLIAVLSVFCFNNAMGQGISPFGANRPQDTSKTKGQIVATAYANPNPAMFVRFDSKGHMIMAVPAGSGGGLVDSVTISNDSLFYWGGGVSFFVGIVNSGGSIDTTGLSDRIAYNLTRIDGLSDTASLHADTLEAHKDWLSSIESEIAGIPIVDSTRYILYSDTARNGSVATYPYVDSLFNEVPPLVDSSRYVLYGDSNTFYITPTQLNERVFIYDVDSFGAIPNDDMDDSGPIQEAINAWYRGGKKGKVVGWGVYDLKNTPTLNVPYPWDSSSTYIQQGQLYLPLSRETDSSKGILEFCPRYSGGIAFNGDGTYPKNTFIIKSTEGTYSNGQNIFQTSGTIVYNANTLYLHDVAFLLKNRGTNPVRMGCVNNTRGNLIAERCFFGVDTVYTALVEPTTSNNFGIRGSNNRDTIGWCINRITNCFSYGLYSGYTISANTYANGNTSAYCLIGIIGTNNSGRAALQIPMHYNKACKYDLSGQSHNGVDSCIMNIGALNCDVDTNSTAWYKNVYTIYDSPNTLTGDVYYNIILKLKRRNDLFARLGGSWVRAYALGEPVTSYEKIKTYDGDIPANGQLLIGDGAEMKLANLTPGFGVDVTNASGSIEVRVDTADLETMFFKNYGNSFGDDFKLGNMNWDQFIYGDGNGRFVFNNGAGPGWRYYFVQNNQDTALYINTRNEVCVGMNAGATADRGHYLFQVNGAVWHKDTVVIDNIPKRATVPDSAVGIVNGLFVAYPTSAGGGGSGTVTSFTFTDGNGFDGTVTNSTTTPALSIDLQADHNFVSNAELTNFTAAYNDKINSGAFSAGQLTLTQQDAGTVTATINDATTSVKGIASFNASDFDVSSGAVSTDYTNGQAASGSTKGFLTSADWTTFNNKQAALGFTAVPDTRTINGNALSSNVTLDIDDVAPTQTGNANKILTTDGTNATWQAPAVGVTINTQSGTTYTLLSSDNGKVVEFTNSSAVTVTVPTGLGTSFTCIIRQNGTGDVTLSASGTTINNANSHTSTRAQYSAFAIIATSTANTFITQGDMD